MQDLAGELPTALAGALRKDIPLLVARALAEDVGAGDVTAALIPAQATGLATLITREPMVLCGRAWFTETFRQLDERVTISWKAAEGEQLPADAVVCELRGPARAILSGERCAMNFLQTLSGTATITREFASALAGTSCRVLDTRKTIPGLRLAQKYAVHCGGGSNHRLGLYDMVLIKENHIAAAGSIAAAIAAARKASPGVPVETEVESLGEFREALAARPEVIMLDEFSPGDMRTAVAERDAVDAATRIEASGGLDLQGIRAVAEAGVDFISIGSLTKHVRAIDLSMRFRSLG